MSWSDRVQSRWDARRRTPAAVEGGGGGPLAVTAEVFIARSAQAIWDAMDDPAQAELANPGTRMRAVEGTGPGVGRQVSVRSRVGVTWSFLVWTVVSELPTGYFELVASGGTPPLPTRVRRWIEHTGEGCRVRWQAEVELPATLTLEQREQFERLTEASLDAAGHRWKQLLETGGLPD